MNRMKQGGPSSHGAAPRALQPSAYAITRVGFMAASAGAPARLRSDLAEARSEGVVAGMRTRPGSAS